MITSLLRPDRYRPATQTIGEILGGNADLSFALEALETAGMLDFVNGAGENIYKSPSNAAFEALAAYSVLQMPMLF